MNSRFKQTSCQYQARTTSSRQSECGDLTGRSAPPRQLKQEDWRQGLSECCSSTLIPPKPQSTKGVGYEMLRNLLPERERKKKQPLTSSIILNKLLVKQPLIIHPIPGRRGVGGSAVTLFLVVMKRSMRLRTSILNCSSCMSDS